MANPKHITQEIAMQRLSDALALYAGRGRSYSLEVLADVTGVPNRTLKSYLAREATPTLTPLMRLFATLPPAFANMVLSLAGLGGATPLSIEAPSGFVTAERLARRAHELALALRDGRIDHRERRALAVEFRALASEAEAFAAGLETGSEGRGSATESP